MNILKSLFARKQPPIAPEGFTDTTEANSLPSIAEELFIAPVPSMDTRRDDVMRANTATEQSETFLLKDFYTLGRSDGYQSKSADHLMFQKTSLKAQYNNTLKADIRTIETRILELNIKLEALRDLNSSMKASLHLKISFLENKMADYVWEQNKCIDGEGKISHCLHQYELGYTRGVEDFCSEAFLLDL